MLRLEGQIIGEWVDLLASECKSAHESAVPLTLDLEGVSYADARGVVLLRALRSHGIRIVNATTLLNELM